MLVSFKFSSKIIPFFQLGFLDGRTGFVFHFLQAYWFRLIVDIKIDAILKSQKDETAK